MKILEFDKYGFPKYWVDYDDPLFGFSLWKQKNKNESCLVRNIPRKFKKVFNQLKEAYKNAAQS